MDSLRAVGLCEVEGNLASGAKVFYRHYNIRVIVEKAVQSFRANEGLR